MIKNLVILKIGGSILTHKDQNIPKFKTRLIKRIISEIRTAKQKENFKIIIVLGTGSFGHPAAKKYKLDKGLVNENSIWGLAQSKRGDFQVCDFFWKYMETEGIPSIPIQPSSITISKNGKISQMYTRLIKKFLELGLVILMFGDEVIDEKTGISICSSDQIAAYLANKLKSKSLFYASDVDGVFDRNPKVSKNAIRFTIVHKQNIAKILSSVKKHNLNDVSNEMGGKLKSIFDFASKKQNIRIFSGLKKGNLYNALLGREVGTRVLLI